MIMNLKLTEGSSNAKTNEHLTMHPQYTTESNTISKSDLYQGYHDGKHQSQYMHTFPIM